MNSGFTNYNSCLQLPKWICLSGRSLFTSVTMTTIAGIALVTLDTPLPAKLAAHPSPWLHQQLNYNCSLHRRRCVFSHDMFPFT
ncbi:hypothetical protein GDO81_013613 [Engystomops pustulosus]|uniref:Uncharacterized protein n=1 Tax=Engystomops pustulosus TaxID=76066 RepID=A0AAV7B1N6_ENGPU|nr:hypothetical protein GDO81_013613 [Engystomops pustulosus]